MKTESVKSSPKPALTVAARRFRRSSWNPSAKKTARMVERHLDLCPGSRCPPLDAPGRRHDRTGTDAVQTSGNFAVQFFVAEASTASRFFALEDARNGAAPSLRSRKPR